jgi:acyl-CoA thioesterase-1
LAFSRNSDIGCETVTERLCVFGDSTAYGCGDAAGGWVARLRTRFEEERADVEVYNLSVLGDDTYDALLRFGPEFSARNGTAAIFHVGLNDSQLSCEYPGPKVPPEAFAGNLNLLLRRALRQTRHVLLVGLHDIDEPRTTPCPWDADRSFRADLVRTYRGLAVEYAARRGVARVDPDELFRPAELVDGVHPGPEGHARLAVAVRRALGRMIPSLAGFV